MTRSLKTIALSFGGFLLASPALGNPLPTAPNQANIKILSEQMDCDQSRNVCVATGDAVAEKLGDAKTKVLKADKITAHFAKEGGTGPLRVTRLEAEGNVFLTIGDIIVQGKRGDYFADSDVAEVFDDVKVTNGENQLDGGYGKVNLKTGHYFVKRDGERVQALIFTKETAKESAEKRGDDKGTKRLEAEGG